MPRFLSCFLLPLISIFTLGCGNSGGKPENSGLKFTRSPSVLVPGYVFCPEEFRCVAKLKNNTQQVQKCNLSMQIESQNNQANKAYLWSNEVENIEIDADSEVKVTFDYRKSLQEIRSESGDTSYRLIGPVPDLLAGRCTPVGVPPGPGTDPVRLEPTGRVGNLNIEAGKHGLAIFQITEPGVYAMQTLGNLDTMMDLTEALDERTPGRVLASDDDSGHSANARISENLGRGTYFLRIKYKSSQNAGMVQVVVSPSGSGSGWCSTYSSTPSQRETLRYLQDMTNKPDCASTYEALKRTATFYLQDTGVSDLSPLSEFTQATRVYLMNTQVSDLSPLKGMTSLILLYFDNTQVSDLNPLRNLQKLKAVGLPFTRVRDVSPLYGLSSLGYIDMTGTQVSADSVNQLRMRLPNAMIRT